MHDGARRGLRPLPPVPVHIHGESEAFVGSAAIVGEWWSGRVARREGGVTLGGSARAYLYSGNKKATLDLRGKTMQFSVDVSHVPCGLIAAFYFVSAQPLGGTGQTKEYCDINTSPACLEYAVFDQTLRHSRAAGLGP